MFPIDENGWDNFYVKMYYLGGLIPDARSLLSSSDLAQIRYEFAHVEQVSKRRRPDELPTARMRKIVTDAFGTLRTDVPPLDSLEDLNRAIEQARGIMTAIENDPDRDKIQFWPDFRAIYPNDNR